jgi:GAF domain-containing protein
VSLTPGDAAALVAAAELASIGADAAFVATLSEDGTRVEVSRVTPDSEGPVYLAFPAAAPYPLAEVFRRQTDLFIESNEQLACDHPGLVRLEEADHACATIPLRGGEGLLLGALNLGFEQPHAFDDAERDAIQALATRCSTAFEQALLRTDAR